MFRFLKSKRGVSVILGIILILLLLSAVFYFNVSSILLNRMTKKSSADIAIEGELLKLSFNIAKSDQALANQFSEQLGVGSSWMQGISLNLDSNSLDKIRTSLPAHVLVKFSPKSLVFQSSELRDLSSGLAGKSVKYSTYSGQLNANIVTDSDYKIVIDNPSDLLRGATESGDLRLSSQLTALFPIASQIARIEISVNGKAIDGSIDLK